jgi:hypothetical protein
MHKNKLRSLGLVTAAFFAATGSLRAGEADLENSRPRPSEFRRAGRHERRDADVSGHRHVRRRGGFRSDAILADEKSAGAQIHERRLAHDLGDVQNVSVQQGKFLAVLWLLIACCILFYFKVLEHKNFGDIAVILLASVLGILGSYGVAWFGIRINTTANSRTAFSALKGNPLRTLSIPLQSGMSVGLLLVSVELFFMISILVFLPNLVGPCFIGFAIGESLGATRAAHLRRHFHENRGHRQRPDENCFQAAGR